MSTKPRQTIVMTRFPYESSWGGEESHTLNLARFFREQGYEVVFMGSCPILLERFKKEHFPTQQVWGGKMIVTSWQLLKSFLLFPLIWLSLRRAFRSLLAHYDVRALYCLSLNEKLFLTAGADKLGIPVTWVEHQEIRSWLTKNPWKWLYRRHSRSAEIIPISKKNEATLKTDLRIDPDQITFIVNGVDLEGFQSKERETKKNLIVAANRFIPKKGLEDFLMAIEILKEKVKPLTVMVIGEGELKNTFQDYISEELNDINCQTHNFLKKEKWQELLKKTDVYVSCARDSNETFSLSTAEALAAGCKVVVTACSGIADFLEDQHDALICDPQDPKLLAEKIQHALKQPESLRKNAQETAKRKFDRIKMHRQYYHLLLRNDGSENNSHP